MNSKNAIKLQKNFSGFWDSCIWIGSEKFSLFLPEYSYLAVNVLTNLLIQMVILKNLYNSCFQSNLLNVSDFWIVVDIICLMALDSTSDSVVGPMVG